MDQDLTLTGGQHEGSVYLSFVFCNNYKHLKVISKIFPRPTDNCCVTHFWVPTHQLRTTDVEHIEKIHCIFLYNIIAAQNKGFRKKIT